MECQNKFCIYEEDEECILSEVSHDNAGVCTDCLFVDIPDEILKGYKEKTLKYYEKLDVKYNE